jgi:hypothetical protein
MENFLVKKFLKKILKFIILLNVCMPFSIFYLFLVYFNGSGYKALKGRMIGKE